MKKLLFVFLILPLFILGQSQEELNKVLSEVSSEMNKNCPMTIDECTTMMSTFGGMGIVMYNLQFDTDCLNDWDMSVSEWKTLQTIAINNSFENKLFTRFVSFV